MPFTIGIDTSTKLIALAAISEDDDVKYKTYKLTGEDFNQKMLGAYNCMCNWLAVMESYNISLSVFIEKPVWVKNSDAHMKLSFIYASVALACMRYDIFPEAVNVMTWKAKVVGYGFADKKSIKEYVLDNFDIKEDLVQDVYDAVCVACYGKALADSG